MNTPDHRHYLREGALRSPEDVLQCVLTFAEDPDVEHDVSDVYNYLSRRLDRERRQACRRGAIAAWRDMSRLIVNGHESDDGLDSYGYEATADVFIVLASEYLAKALAFRAAARAK